MRVEIKPSVETWDRFWLAEKNGPKKPNFFLINAIKKAMDGSVDDKRILEVGCGTSSEAIELSRQGAEISVLDFSRPALDVLGRRADEGRVNLLSVQADAEELPFTDCTFDLVYSQGLVEHFLPSDKLMREQVRVVKPGGFVLVDVPQLFSLQAVTKGILMKIDRWPFGWERNYSEEQLRKLLGSFGLEPVAAYAYGYIPPINLSTEIIDSLREWGYKMTYKKRGEEVVTPLGGLKFRFQKTWLARHLLSCIGVMARKA